MAYTVYILQTSSNTFYTGQTNNLEKRLKEHASKSRRSAKYLRRFDSFKLVYQEPQANLSKALKRENEIKRLSHVEKESLIKDKG